MTSVSPAVILLYRQYRCLAATTQGDGVATVRWLVAVAVVAPTGVDIDVPDEPARLVLLRLGSARHGSLRYRVENLARFGSFKNSSQLITS
jgi:hypothetical protein